MKALQQGQADGMCGLYAVLNFLNGTEWNQKPSDGLWYILDACRTLGFFTPQHLIAGLDDYHLKAILDLQIGNFRLPFETQFLSDVSTKFPSLSTRQIAIRAVKKGGAIIVQKARGGHWLLIARSGHDPVVFDSADGSGDPRPLEERSLSSPQGWGVIILPCERPIPQVEL